MSEFTVRIELRHATEDDYEKLRVEMEERGVSRLLPGGDGGKYLLPTVCWTTRSMVSWWRRGTPRPASYMKFQSA